MSARTSLEETDWSTFKDIAPSKDIHAPPGSPPSRSPPGNALSHPSRSPQSRLSPPFSSSADPASLDPAEAPSRGADEAGQRGRAQEKDVRERVLEKLGLDEEGERRLSVGGEKKFVGVGLGLEVAADDEVESASCGHEGVSVKEKLATPEGTSPPSPPPSPLLPPSPHHSHHHPIPRALSPDKSIPLPTRLAGRLEAVVGKLRGDEAMVLDGRVREFGVGVAVGVEGEGEGVKGGD
ncbi:hypothetical protein JCM6882_009254 [Rhodosporidiobolus microsporus]